ncbi:MAG: hypothetical protein AAF682_17755 [Planctomycetota bacterium]
MLRPVVLLSLALASLASAPQDGVEGPRCGKCKRVGLLPCAEHKKLDLSYAGDVLFCSFLADCESCGGTGLVDCPKCEHPEAVARNDAKKAVVGERAEALAALDDAMGRTLRKAESEHFVLVWEVDRLKVGRKKIGDHALLHLYLRRLEELYAAYTELLGVDDDQLEKKCEVFVWSDLQDHLKAGTEFCRFSQEAGTLSLGNEPKYSVVGLTKTRKTDAQLHRHLVHNVTHLLMSHQRPVTWVGNIRGGWADAGLAHYFEDKLFETCDNYCYKASNEIPDYKGKAWRPMVRKLVEDEAAPAATEVFQQNTVSLTADHHLVSFSFMDFLLATDREKTNRLLIRLRSRVPTRDALREIFGWKEEDFEKEWRAWVAGNYPSR